MKAIASPSSPEASSIVTAAESSSVTVPVAVSVARTVWEVPETRRLTVKVSSYSASSSSVVETVNVRVSLALPVKLIAAVFSV